MRSYTDVITYNVLNYLGLFFSLNHVLIFVSRSIEKMKDYEGNSVDYCEI